MPNDRVPKHKQRLAEGNAKLQNKVSNKQGPTDTDKGGNSPEQKQNVSPAGRMSRESINEEGTDKHVADRKKEKNKKFGR